MFYDNFISYCNNVNKAPSAVASELGLSRASVNGWKHGKVPTDANQKRIADYFGISVAELMAEQKEKPVLTKKDERDISKKMEETLSQLEKQQAGLMFDGEPLDDETKELLAISLKNSLELAKKIAKQKYTPKKYRKKSE